MASFMRVSLTVSLLLVSAVAAREAPLGEEKTYAPPYGTPSGSSPVTPTPDYSPTPSGSSPTTPDVPYSPAPSGASPVTPTPDVPYSPPYAEPAPTTPYTDPTPSTPTPASPGTCSWWSSNTSSFPSVISLLSTIVDAFTSLTGGSSGSGSSTGVGSIISSIFGSQMTVYQGLTNTRNDGFGALARQSSAALLNSLTRRDYPFNAFQVKTQFRNSLGSQQQAFNTARLFENANNAIGAGRH